jgi:hypothetical protein
MKPKSTYLLSIFGLISAAVIFAGCAHTTITNQALEFNKAVQQHRLDSLFLNVIRAAHREPMAMTSINTVAATNTASGGLTSLAFPFGPLSRTPPYTATFDAHLTRQPRFDLQILDNDTEFVKGFMAPVDEKTINYFLGQGWRPKMLAYLFIESLQGQVEDFTDRAEIARMYNGHPPARVKVPNEPDNPVFDFLIDKYLPNLQVSDTGFKIVKSNVKVYTRSPQAILYYLGELARVSLGETHGTIPVIDGQQLFVVRMGPKTSLDAAVSIDFRGRFYHIPEDPRSRSLSTLTLVQQLVNMQAKKVQPPTTAIQLIGG